MQKVKSANVVVVGLSQKKLYNNYTTSSGFKLLLCLMIYFQAFYEQIGLLSNFKCGIVYICG